MKKTLSGKGKSKLLVLGAGGHARTVLSILDSLGQWEVVGILDREEKSEKEIISGVSVLGSWGNLSKFRSQGISNAVVAVGDNLERRQLFGLLTESGFSIPTLVHPGAFVDKSATLGGGCVICVGAIICAQVKLGSNVLVNAGPIVDHETIVEDDVHIGSGCNISGRVKIGQRAFLGISTTIFEKKRVGRNVVLGAGSVLMDNLPNDVVACGAPAKISRKMEL
jgi:sugar O-acyltransferase (sialic acid O-acetyltransferase NeuD family)